MTEQLICKCVPLFFHGLQRTFTVKKLSIALFRTASVHCIKKEADLSVVIFLTEQRIDCQNSSTVCRGPISSIDGCRYLVELVLKQGTTRATEGFHSLLHFTKEELLIGNPLRCVTQLNQLLQHELWPLQFFTFWCCLCNGIIWYS